MGRLQGNGETCKLKLFLNLIKCLFIPVQVCPSETVHKVLSSRLRHVFSTRLSVGVAPDRPCSPLPREPGLWWVPRMSVPWSPCLPSSRFMAITLASVTRMYCYLSCSLGCFIFRVLGRDCICHGGLSPIVAVGSSPLVNSENVLTDTHSLGVSFRRV